MSDRQNHNDSDQIFKRFWIWWKSRSNSTTPSNHDVKPTAATKAATPISTTSRTISTIRKKLPFPKTNPVSITSTTGIAPIMMKAFQPAPLIAPTASYTTDCAPIWVPVNHLLFQIANVCFLLSFLAPQTRNGLILLRGGVMVGCLFMNLWAYFIVNYMVAVLWNAVFLVINMAYLICHLYTISHITFEEELETIYRKIFAPLNVSRYQYKQAMNCTRGVQTLKRTELYAMERDSMSDALSLVISGSFMVYQNERLMYFVKAKQFLDSPEYCRGSDLFKVSIMAMEDSRVLIWHRPKLRARFLKDSHLQAAFNHLVGRDVVKKLKQIIREFRNPNDRYKSKRDSLKRNSESEREE